MTQSNTKASTNERSAIVGLGSFLTLAIPIVALLVILLSGSHILLNYIHVLTAATWTGTDLFMGLVMSRVMRGLSPQSRAEIIKKLVPTMLFFMPALAAVTITSGVYLASSMGLSFFSRPLIIIFVMLGILSIQGFGLILPNEVRVFLETSKANPNIEKVVKLGMRNIYFAGSQTIFQMAMIFMMGYGIITLH
jgi:hypothetical protein